MSLLEKASLVVTPNAYKESKLYSVIPNTTLGDMDVVRATTATRVNEQGLIEVVPRNLFVYSNDFTNGNWIKSNGTISGTLYSNPSGVVNASKFIPNNSVTSSYLGQGVINNSVSSTFTVFVKPDGFNRVAFWDGFVTAKFVAFDLILGTIVNTSGATGTIINVGNGWFKCTMSANMPNNTIGWLISPIGNSAVGPFDPQIVGDGVKGIQVYAAQVENFATATTYFPTTDRLNIPRIDYTNGSCPSLLVEPQRTNLITYSNDYTNAIWSKDYAIITPNATTSPDGTNNGTKLIGKNINDIQILYRTLTVPNGNTVFSFYVKKAEYSKAGIRLGGTANNATIAFDLDLNAIIYQAGSILSSQIIDLSNDWKRIILTVNITNEFAAPCVFGLPNSGYTWDAGNLPIYTGNGTSGIYIYGAQLEQGSYATSYIPTVASSVTRNADIISKTGISSLIGQTEGTVFANIDYDSNISGTKIITGLALDASSFIYSFISGTTLVLSIYNGGTLQCYLTYALPSSGKYKIAIGYKLNDFIIYVNGVNVASQTSGTVPTCSILYLGNDFLTVYNKLNYDSLQLYKTRLTNTELAQLTTI